jgi:hypothetical protein
MSPDQDVGAALVLATVGSAGVVDVGGTAEDGVAPGALVVGDEVGPVEAPGALLVAGADVDEGVVGAVLRARLDVGATGAGWTTPPAGLVVSAAVGCTVR